ncbi:MAG: hypothetical protein ABSD46_12010 [Bacteroidota bacterium]
MINARFYPAIKQEAQGILEKIGWNPSVEFKGSYLFSKSCGCTEVEIEKRVLAAHQLLDLNIAQSNRRMIFHYGRLKSKNQRDDYLHGVPGLLNKVLPHALKGAGKNLISINCDERDDITVTELHKYISPCAIKKGYVVLENVVRAKSNFDTIGIMYADLVSYLAGRIDTISNDSELFEGITEEQLNQNGKIRKLKSSKELISKIKLNLYRPKNKSVRTA